MKTSRRSLFALAFAALAVSSIGAAAAAAADLKEVRIGFQKAGIQPAVKERGSIENALKDKGLTVRWVEFAFGPPLLEALNTGNIDFGYTGDTPPIFAQAATANLLYVAALPASGKNEGIVVPANSPIKTIADLKGKRLGIPKGSSAHNTAVAILEKAGLQFSDVNAVYLPPADGAAAFAGGTVDAWAIWDPYFALAEKSGARVLSFAGDAHASIGFFLANREFTSAHGDIVALLNQTFAREAQWANGHHDEITKSLASATGVDPEIVRTFVARSVFEVTPVTDKVLAEQQQTADRFYKLGLIPKPINVRDIVWKWSPAS